MLRSEQHPDKPDATKPTILAERTLNRLHPVETDTYWDMFDQYFSLAAGPALADAYESTSSSPSDQSAGTSRSKFDISRYEGQSPNATSKGGGQEEQGPARGGRVARQVGELSRKVETLSNAQQGMEDKIDALQAQQQTIIQMLKKLTS